MTIQPRPTPGAADVAPGTWQVRFTGMMRELDAILDGAACDAPTPRRRGRSATAPASLRSADVQADVQRVTEGSAWGEAIQLRALREQRTAAGRDSSVRALAHDLESSVSRVGDLLQIADAFTETDVLLIALPDGPSDEAISDLELRGHARLSRLSFRALRAVARLPRFIRAADIRRLAGEAAARRAGTTRDTSDADSDGDGEAVSNDPASLTRSLTPGGGS